MKNANIKLTINCEVKVETAIRSIILNWLGEKEVLVNICNSIEDKSDNGFIDIRELYYIIRNMDKLNKINNSKTIINEIIEENISSKTLADMILKNIIEVKKEDNKISEKSFPKNTFEAKRGSDNIFGKGFPKIDSISKNRLELEEKNKVFNQVPERIKVEEPELFGEYLKQEESNIFDEYLERIKDQNKKRDYLKSLRKCVNETIDDIKANQSIQFFRRLNLTQSILILNQYPIDLEVLIQIIRSEDLSLSKNLQDTIIEKLNDNKVLILGNSLYSNVGVGYFTLYDICGGYQLFKDVMKPLIPNYMELANIIKPIYNEAVKDPNFVLSTIEKDRYRVDKLSGEPISLGFVNVGKLDIEPEITNEEPCGHLFIVDGDKKKPLSIKKFIMIKDNK